MRAARCATLLILFAFGPLAAAQEEPKPDQVKKMYDDALAQLKAAQDRTSELARENEKLATQIKELEDKLKVQDRQLEQFRRDAAEHAERTFALRSHYAAWKAFVGRHPEIGTKWRVYLGDNIVVPKPSGWACDQWPLEGFE